MYLFGKNFNSLQRKKGFEGLSLLAELIHCYLCAMVFYWMVVVVIQSFSRKRVSFLLIDIILNSKSH